MHAINLPTLSLLYPVMVANGCSVGTNPNNYIHVIKQFDEWQSVDAATCPGSPGHWSEAEEETAISP